MSDYITNANGVLVPNYNNINQALSRGNSVVTPSFVPNSITNIGSYISDAWDGLFGKQQQHPFDWSRYSIKDGALVGIGNAFGHYLDTNFGARFNNLSPQQQSSVFAGWQNGLQAQARNEPTGLDYASFGVNTLFSGLNALMSYRGLKAQEKALNENIALNRANYKQLADTLNTQYRDQLSGRSRVNQGVGALNRARSSYASKKLDTTY